MYSVNDGQIGALQPGGGIAGGWIFQLPDGNCVYHAGDTNLYSDMSLWSKLYAPNVAILPIGGHYCMVLLLIALSGCRCE